MGLEGEKTNYSIMRKISVLRKHKDRKSGCLNNRPLNLLF